MCKITLISFIVVFSAVFAIAAGAQQENQGLNDKILELQEQWKGIMQGEYNPSTIQPKVRERSSLDSDSYPAKHSRKPLHKRSESQSR